MYFTRGNIISMGGILWCIVVTKVMTLTIRPNPRVPASSALKAGDTLEARSVISVLPSITKVFRR